jgi:hypothetical protein
MMTMQQVLLAHKVNQKLPDRELLPVAEQQEPEVVQLVLEQLVPELQEQAVVQVERTDHN